MLLLPGHWYLSKAALEYIGGLRLVNEPHVTPDGAAILVFAPGGGEVHPATGEAAETPPCLVPQADSSADPLQRDLMHVARVGGQATIRRVEVPPEALPDLERLVEYDHLPEARKDRDAYPEGHRLA